MKDIKSTRVSNSYQRLPFGRDRQAVIDAGRLRNRRHIIHGLLNYDVSQARAIIQEHQQRSGEKLSFTAFIVGCLGVAVAGDPAVQAYRNWRRQLVVFHDVDIVTMIETQRDGVALPHIIRQANRKSYRDIHDEIRAVQNRPGHSQQQSGIYRLGAYAPRPVRDLFWWVLRRDPHRLKHYAGTVVVTAVGMFGRGGGWGLGFLPLHTLGLTIGGITIKPFLEDGRLVPREVLSVTLALDHDIVDGAPAARFAEQLRLLVEGAELLRPE